MEVLPRLLLKSLSAITLVVFILSVATLIVTLRKPKRVSILSMVVTVVISLMTLVVFASLARYRPPPLSWLLLVAAGIAIGAVWARTTKVFASGDQVMSRNSTSYLAVWGGIFTITQLITIATNRPPNVAMALLVMGTAIVWGSNGAILGRYFRVKADSSLRVDSAGQSHGQAGTVGASACEAIAPMPGGECPRCSAASRKGAAFCGKCGAKL